MAKTTEQSPLGMQQTAYSIDTGKQGIIDQVALAPIGSQTGDPIPGMAKNASVATAVYFARNLSHQVEREYLFQRVSAIGHVPDDIQRKYHMDGATIQQQIHQGSDAFDQMKVAVEPVHKTFRWDGKPYLIPAATEKGEAGDWRPIPEGIYDLLVGNWDVRHGKDQFEAQACREMASNRWGGKCVAFEEGQERKPHQYIELRREAIESTPLAVDKEKVYAGIRIE